MRYGVSACTPLNEEIEQTIKAARTAKEFDSCSWLDHKCKGLRVLCLADTCNVQRQPRRMPGFNQETINQ